MSGIPASLADAVADRYRLERELGAGGMATVFLAEDLKHRRMVAVKVLRPELAEALGPERFLREIETTAALRHPHILPLYDSGSAAGFLFYVMPYVEGETLRDQLERDRQLPIDEALGIARDVADALGYAHARGVVHRDIKPDNILIEDGHAVVADFGIARAVSAAGGDRLTQTGMAVGTPLYMSPEQASGDRDVDGRSDLYSLGCVLYEMLAGQPPFTGPTVEAIARQHITVQVAPVTNLRPAVSPAIAGALARILEKNPADRFSPAAQFVQALAAGEPAGAQPSPTPTPARWPLRLGGAAAVVVALLAVWWGVRTVGSNDAPTYERVAVLPLENRTGDSAQAFFADGMTREVIGVLSDAGVRVLGYRAVAPYRDDATPLADIAGALDVDAIVSGAVLAVGDLVQVSAELIDPRTGENLWGRSFSRPATEVVTLQHELASEVARGIRARLTPDQQAAFAAAPSVNPKAYTQYLLGQQQATLRTPDGFVRAVDHLNRSIALDSTFAPAWAALAMTNAYGLLYQLTPRDSGRAVIERAAARAAALDERLADPWFARGVAHLHADWNFAAAEDDFRRGFERNGSTEARGLYGWTMWETGQYDKALEPTLQLIAEEPTTAQWRSDLAWSHWSRGDNAAARASLLEAIAADSTFYEAYDLLSLVENDRGDTAAALRYHRRAIEVAGGDYWVRQFSQAVLAKGRGDTNEVRVVLRELEGDPRYAQRAVLHYIIGEVDETYALLERAIETRDGDVLWILTSIPYLYPLHGDPRFEALVRRVGLPPRSPT